MSQSLKIHIDGQLLDQADAKISVFDHGLLYGDGVFEGIRFYNDRVFRLDEHIDRLYDSAKAIHLTIPISKSEMEAAVLETIRANDLHDGYIRLVITRGVGGLGLSPYRCEKASVIVIASTIALYDPEVYEKGLKLVTCSTRRPSHDTLSPAVKSLNYLSNVMAKIEAIAGDADDLVPVTHSRNMQQAFQEVKVSSELFELPGAGHGFQGEDARIATEKMVDWFVKQLGKPAS